MQTYINIKTVTGKHLTEANTLIGNSQILLLESTGRLQD
ncbi:unnamed protein product [Nezara viridula]|uniref:Uncharacterized protein n=1 Tax=Nezara viridula TaxID=85310 RepID=A0A9P0HHM0_NEZVI|nr:unnamed protein product [Nezara viridula]